MLNKKLLNLIKKIFLLTILVSVIVIFIMVFFIWNYMSKVGDINLDVDLPQKVAKGKPFDIGIKIVNNSNLNLQNAFLNIYLDKGLIFWENSSSEELLKENIGIIGGGMLIKKNYKIIPVGDVDSSYQVKISFVYFNNKGSRFEIKKDYNIKISPSVFTIKVKTPPQVEVGSLFTFEISYQNNSGYDFSNTYFLIDYPENFEISEASVPFSRVDKKFKLGPSLNNSLRTISITGVITDYELGSLTIPIKLYLLINNKEYNVADYKLNLIFSSSNLQLKILVNGKENYIAKQGESLKYNIFFENKKNMAIKNAVFKIKLNGFVDWESINTNGKYNKETKIITWDAETNPQLAFLEPFYAGNFFLELKTKKFEIKNIEDLSDKNLAVILNAYLLGGDKEKKKVVFETMKLVKVEGTVYFNTVFYPHKTSSDITVYWYITNFGNDLAYAKVEAPLSSSFYFKNSGSNLGDIVPYYNDETKNVIWEIGDIFANSSFLNGPIKGFFEISRNTNKNEEEQEIILGKSKFTALDKFTKKNILIEKEGVTLGDLVKFKKNQDISELL
jgi:hypothetical protein